MYNLLDFMFFVFLFLLFPTWAIEMRGLDVALVVAALELALIVVAALLPVGLSSRAGRIVVALVALSVLNAACNLIWPLRI